MQDLSTAQRKLDNLSAQIIAFELEIGMPPDAIAKAQWRMAQETAKRLKPVVGRRITETLRLTARLEALKDRRRHADEFADARAQVGR
jgi:hypothetical protein